MHFTIWIFKTVLSHWPLFCKGYLTISWSVEVQIKLWKRRCKEVIFSYFIFPFFPTFAKFQDLSRLFQYLFLKERPFMDKAHQSMHVSNNGGKPKRTRSSKNPNTITFKEFDLGGGEHIRFGMSLCSFVCLSPFVHPPVEMILLTHVLSNWYIDFSENLYFYSFMCT